MCEDCPGEEKRTLKKTDPITLEDLAALVDGEGNIRDQKEWDKVKERAYSNPAKRASDGKFV